MNLTKLTKPRARWVEFKLKVAEAVSRALYDKLLDQGISVKDFGAKGDGVTDDTDSIMRAQAYVNNGTLHFPNGTYAVTTVNLGSNGIKITGNANFLGIATEATDAVVVIQGRGMSIQSLSVNQNFNTNYTSAVKWHSRAKGDPAQFNKIHEMYVGNCLIGLLFGQLKGTPVQDAPQSENSITHFHSRGCERAIYFNQSNGFLFIGESTINSLRNEWEIFNAGKYNYTRARCIEMYQGALFIANGEVLKTDTQLGYGIEMYGGHLKASNMGWEIACTNMKLHGGDIELNNISAYFSNASGSFNEIEQSAKGKLLISNSIFKKADGAKNANTAFIKHNGTTMDIVLSNIILDNQINVAAFKNENNINTTTINMQISNLRINEGENTNRPDVIMSSNDKSSDKLKALRIDTSGNTTEGWFLNVSYGGGTTLTVEDSYPSGTPKKYSNSLMIHATGHAYASTLDVTSIDSIKNTGLAVTEGQQVLVSGYLRASKEGSQQDFGIITNDGTAGNMGYRGEISQPAVVHDWRYYEFVVIVQAGVKYIGAGIRAETSDVQFVDVTLQFLN